MIAAYALSRITFRGRQAYLNWILSQRFMPPIAIIVPIVFMFHYAGLRDTVIGLILIHTLINLPVAVLLMKSFFDDVPVDVDEAAMLDGATRFQIFRKVILPLVTRRRRGDGGALLHLLVDRVPAVAVPRPTRSARCR